MIPAERLEVFAVEDTTAQIVWGGLGPGAVRLCWPGGERDGRSVGGPGGMVIDGLAPGTTTEVEVLLDGRTAGRVAVTTLAPPPGRELARFATLNDLHLGTRRFGRFPEFVEDVPHARAHPVRCARAAVDDAIAWGAQRLVVKGDIVHASHPHTWTMVGDVFGDTAIPVDLLCGNHDRNHISTVDPFTEAGRSGLTLRRHVTTIDLDGLRLVLIDSSVNWLDIGVWRPHTAAVRQAVATTDLPVMLLVHHQPQETTIPLYIPRGIPAVVANRFLRTMRDANPRIIGSSGHTHRNRHRTIEGVPWSEIGSPKDYPGVWAGYVVYTGGIRQVVRRITRPDCIGWTEQTRRVAGGTWGRWSPGTLDQRCFTHQWPELSGRRAVTSPTEVGRRGRS